MANEDFYLSFGSNMPEWAKGIKSQARDLLRPGGELANLHDALQRIDRLGGKIPGIGGGASGHSQAQTTANLDIDTSNFQREIDAMATEVREAMRGVAALVKVMAPALEGAKEYVKHDNLSRAAREREARLAAQGQSNLRNSGPSQNALVLQSALNRQAGPSNLSQPAKVSVAGLSQVQLDRGSVDRLVRAVHEVRDAVRAQTAAGAKGGKGGGGGGTPAPAAAAEAEAKSEQTRLQQLTQRIGTIESKAQQLISLISATGGAANEAMTEALKEAQAELSEMRAEARKLERETTGVTSRQQKARNKAEFARGPDLPEEEYDRRRSMVQAINLASTGAGNFSTAVGRGKGQYSKEQLKAIATQLTKLGFTVPFNKNTNVADLSQGIVSAAQAFKGQYGADLPDELKTGRRLVSDKVSDAVRDIIAAANISAVEAAEEAAARDTVRLARLTGHLPKDPIEELTKTKPVGESAIGVPRTLVKGGEYSDQFGYLEATDMLRQRALGRAANLATSRPDFDPYAVNLRESVKGQGPEAKAARQAFIALRQGYRELDDLGNAFRTFTQALSENEGFIERASTRLAEGRAKPTDEAKLAAAQDRAEQLRTVLESGQFKGLQDVFADPEFQRGLEARNVSRAAQDEWIKQQEGRRNAVPDIRDAMGAAISDLRLAPGTKDTYVSAVPGLRYDRTKMKYGFRDPERDPAELNDLNKYARFFSLQQRAGQIGDEVDAGDRPMEDLDKILRKTENSAVAFSKELERIFKVVIPVSKLLGSGPGDYTFIDPKNERDEQRRIDRYRAQQELAKPNQPKPTDTPSQAADRADLAVRVAKFKLEKALKRQADASEKLTDAEKKLEQGYEQLSGDQKNQVAAAYGRLSETLSRFNALERTQATWEPATAKYRGASGDVASRAALDRAEARIPLMEEEEKALKRRVSAQKAAITRLTKAEATEEKIEAARGRLLAAERELASHQANLAKTRKFYTTGEGGSDTGGWINATRIGMESETALLQKYPERGNHPGEPVDTLGYEARFGYAPALTEVKAEVEKELEQIRQVLGQVAGSNKRRQVLLEELDKLKTRQPEVVKEIAAARAEGDLSENAGYHAAKEEQGRNEARIKEIENELAKALSVEALENFAKEAAFADRQVEELRASVAELGGAADVAAKKAGRTVVNAGDRAIDTSPEATALRQQIAAAQSKRTAYGDLKTRRDAAEKGSPEWESLNREFLAMRAEGVPTRGQMKKLRQSLLKLDTAAAAAAREAEKKAGGGGAGAGGGGGRTAQGGSGPNDGSTNSILRQILASVNEIKNKMGRGGTRTQTVKTDEQGNPIPPKPRKPSVPQYAALQNSDDPRDAALAAAAKQQRVELERIAATRVATRLEEAQGRQERDTAKAREKATRITAAEAHEKVQLANATRLLDSAAQNELENLRQLTKAGADEVRVAQAQARALAAVNNALTRQGVSGRDRKAIGQTLLSEASGQKVNAPLYEEISRSARSVNGFQVVDEAMAGTVPQGGVFGEHSVFTKAMFGNHGFWSRVMASTGTFVVRNFTAGFVFGMTNALQEIITQAILTESTWIRVSDALRQTGRDAGDLRTQLQDISSSYGVALNDVYQTAAGLSGLFESTDDIAAATKVVAELQAISMGALNAQEAMGALASITGAYSDELESGVGGLTHVADVLTVLQNVIGTNVETIAEGVGSLSGLSQQLNINLEDTGAYVAQIAKLTNQTGAASGEQFGRILASFQTGRGRAALQEALPDSGIMGAINEGQYGQALQILLKDWDSLSESQQRNLSVSLAGQRQARAFAALTSDTTKVLNAARQARDADGQAAERAANIAATLNGQLARLNSNLQNLAQNLVRTGLLDFFGLLLKVTNAVLSTVNKLFSEFNDLTDNSPILTFVKRLTFGLVGLIATLKIGGAAFRGFRASLAQLQVSESVVGAGLRAATGPAPATGGPLFASRTPYTGPISAYGSGSRFDRFAQARLDRASAASLGASSLNSVNGQVVPQRTFAVSSAGVAEQQNLTRSQSASIRANQALARTTGLATKGLGGVGSALGSMATSAFGAEAAAVAVTAAIIALVNDLQKTADVANFVNDQIEKYDTTTGAKIPGADEKIYYGAAYENSQQLNKDRSGLIEGLVYSNIRRPWDQITNPGDTLGKMWGDFKESKGNPLSLIPSVAAFQDLGDGDFEKDYNKWRGILDDKTAGILKALDDATDDAITQAESQANPSSEFNGLSQTIIDKSNLLNPSTYTPEQATALTEDIHDQINKARAEVLAKFKSGDLTPEEAQTALGELEKVTYETDERLTALLLFAQGVAQQDVLSSDQLTRLSSIRSQLSAARASGAGPEVYEGLKAISDEIGIRPTSDIGKRLEKQFDPEAGIAGVIRRDQKIAQDAYKQALARYKSYTSGEQSIDDTQIDEAEGQLTSAITDMANATENAIQTFITTSQNVAGVAAGRGQYRRSYDALIRGIANIESVRDRESEGPQLRAQRNSNEQQLAEQAATNLAQGMNARLEAAKARNQGSQAQARIEAEIAQNEFFALKSAQNAAKIAGGEGPTMQAIRAAKNRWVSAQIALATVAQQANIAAMTAQAAALWNGISIAQAQEGIAAQQYKDAVDNFGKKSPEALNALAALTTSQHATVTTMDQVAQATRDAAAAAIPQGDAVAVTQQALANAYAALDAARKYGTNSAEYQGALAQVYQAQQAAQAAQSAIAVAQAQLAQAYAEARGDAVAAAQAGVAVAQATLSAALQASGGAQSADVLSAQAQLVAANEAVNQAQADLVASRVQISIAMADAAGNTVRSAALALKMARLRLKAALEKSNGEMTAEVNQAKAEVISAEASARDAVLQDQLDTIDFNLQMGRITQSQAIAALREILKTADLTKQQRRDLMLQIKGMEDELSGSPWNFGDITLPKPYQMRRYIEERKRYNTKVLDAAVEASSSLNSATGNPGSVYNDNRSATFIISGSDLRAIRQEIEKALGNVRRTRTTSPRRGRR